LTLLLVHCHLGGELTASIPTHRGHYNDAIYYWRQIQTFSQVGFQGGYYTAEEAPAPVGWSHFYAQGPTFPLIYGTLGRLFGWHSFSGPLFNLALVTLALGFFLRAARLDVRQSLLAGLTLATQWPLLLYLPSTMQESLHHAFAIAIAWVFLRLSSGQRPAPAVSAAFLLLIATASLVRLTWAFLLFPFFLLHLARWSLRGAAVALALAASLMAGIALVVALFHAPYPYAFTDRLLADLSASVWAGVETLLRHAGSNLSLLPRGDPLQVLQRTQALGLIGIAGASGLLRARRARVASAPARRGLPPREVAFHLPNLAAVLLLNLAIYELSIWRDYRVLAPHLLLSALVLIGSGRQGLAASLALSNALFLPAFLAVYRASWSPQFDFDQRRIAAFRERTRDWIAYDAGAENPWCNTLLFWSSARTDWSFPPELMGIDPGIGISFAYWPGRLALPPKSKYLLLEAWMAERLNLRNLRMLGATPIGNLYRNPDARCGAEPG
jgi:hypothetical protein